MAERLDISLAGRMTLAVDGRASVEVTLGSRARVAFAYLVMERWRPVAADELAQAVWGDDLPTTWRAALRGVIARVRGVLTGAGLDASKVLTSGVSGYQVRLPPGSTVDVELAEAALQTAAKEVPVDPKRACHEAGRAVTTLRGQFLRPGDGAWVERRQAQQSELHLRALETLAEAASASGDHDTALWAAKGAVALEPLRESAHRLVMAAHEAADNRGAALRAYERCRRLLAEELGVDPAAQTKAVYLGLLGEKPPEVANQRDGLAAGNLPVPVTQFIGRDRDRAEVKNLLLATRLITLTGPGGLGKSRLGLEVAGDVGPDYPDGVWLVELAGLTTPHLLAEQVMSDLEVPPARGYSAMQSLSAHLGRRRLLLILDNCEHLVSACASLVDHLLKRCAGVDVMVTSREALRMAGETVWMVAPLSTPTGDDPPCLGSLLRYDAVALFMDRARAAAPELDLDPAADAVAAICRRLEGIPLAIELAAARVRSMAVADIAARLSDPLRLLDAGPRNAPARQQTLRATLDWSYEALSDKERRLFARVSVFAADFTVEAADAVWSDGPDAALDTLSHLVDKSVVLAHRSGPTTRYRLLEMMRQYGYEVLTNTGFELEARQGQLRWAATLAEAAEAGLDSPDQPSWLQLLDAEHNNLRGVLDWAAARPEELCGPRTGAALWRYWEIRGYLHEGRSRLEALMGPTTSAALRAKLCNSAGILAQNQGDQAAARAFYQQALELRRSLNDDLGVVAALNGLGNVAVSEDDLFCAQDIFRQNLAASRELGDPRVIAASLMNLGVVVQLLFVAGRTELPAGAAEAEALYLESLRRYRDLGDKRGVAQSLENLGAVAPYRCEEASAQAYLEESLAVRRALRDTSGIASSARFLGHLALRSGDYRAARSLHEECLAIDVDLGHHVLVVSDLASLAEGAHGEGDEAEAQRLLARALAASNDIGSGEKAEGVRTRLAQIRSGFSSSTTGVG
ncbi:MAG: hypothetical protein M3381_11215 [Actinomycetota bacterium]|nr:hypothetical protein [Actinomycetota bacterium]